MGSFSLLFFFLVNLSVLIDYMTLDQLECVLLFFFFFSHTTVEHVYKAAKSNNTTHGNNTNKKSTSGVSVMHDPNPTVEKP